MAEYLPPIVQEFRGDASGLLKEVAKVDAAYDGLGRKSKKTTDGLGRDEKDSEKAISDFDRLLRSKLKDGESALDGFQREVATARTRVTELRTELQRSGGDNSAGLFQDLKAAESDLKKLENIGETILPGFKKSMQNTGKQGGKALAEETESGFGEAFSAIPIRGEIIGALIAASPLLIAQLGAAVATAVGTVGVVGGIVGAAHDPRVLGAFSGLGHEALSIFQDVTQVFVGPVLAGIHDIENMFASIQPGLEDAFRTLSMAARPLLDGFGGFITHMLPGLEDAFTNSLPLLEQFAKLLPMVGSALGQMFRDITKDGTGGKLALEALVGTLANAFILVGKIVNWSEHLFTMVMIGMREILSVASSVAMAVASVASVFGIGQKQATDFAHGLQRAHDALDREIKDAQKSNDTNDLLNVVYANQTNQVNQLGDAYHLTSDELEALVQGSDQLLDLEYKMSNSQVAMYQSLSSFKDTLKSTRHEWNLTTKAGQANQSALNAANEGIVRYYQSLAELHPLTRQQVLDELALETNLYNQAKAAGASQSNLQTISDTIKVLHQRLDELNHTSVTFSVHGVMTGDVALPSKAGKIAFEHGGVVRAAQGLVSGVLPPRDPGTWVLAGEKGTLGEVFMPLAGISRQRAMSLAQVAGDAHGFDVVPRAPHIVAGGNYGGGNQPLMVVLTLDGKVLHRSLIQPSQRYKLRTGTTGLS